MSHLFFSDAGKRIIDQKRMPQMLASGYFFTEGPVWSRREGRLYFTNFADNTIYSLTPGEQPRLFRANSGRAVGLSLRKDHVLVGAETATHAVTLVYSDHSEIIANQYEGSMLNSPNDVIVSTSGDIYFTDPYSVAMKGPRELDFNGFYRVPYSHGKHGETKLLGIMERPNGLALSPDESILYVNDTNHNHILAYALQCDGTASLIGIFARLDPQYGPGVADGMKVDQEGNVYVTGPGGIWVFSSAGDRLALIAFPQEVGNFCFGGSDGCTLFATATTSVYSMQTEIPGIMPQLLGKE